MGTKRLAGWKDPGLDGARELCASGLEGHCCPLPWGPV